MRQFAVFAAQFADFVVTLHRPKLTFPDLITPQSKFLDNDLWLKYKVPIEQKEHVMYNLLCDNWVNVVYLSGKPDRISLVQTLKDAHCLQLAYSNPMDRFAVFRFLLALGYWCFANTNVEPEPDKPLPVSWIPWLEENKEYFELFGDGKRFFQADPSSRIRAITDLIHEIPTAHNLCHFKHVTDYIDGLCEACCIKGLLRLPVFTTVGGRGIGAGINNTPPFYLLWHANDLAGMLVQNWQPWDNMGIPAWLGSFQKESRKVGLLAGMTWLPRKVHLHDPVSGQAACCSCGLPSKALVYSCSIKPEPVPEGLKWKDPHGVYTDQGKSLQSKIKLMSNDRYTFADRDWYSPLFSYLHAEGNSRQGKLWLVGFASDKAKSIDIWDKIIELEGTDTNDELLAQLANRATALNAMRKKPLRGDFKKSVGTPQIADIIPHAESRIAINAGKMTENRGYSWQDADTEYGELLTKVACSLEPAQTVDARLKRGKFISRKPWPVIPESKTKPAEEDQNE